MSFLYKKNESNLFIVDQQIQPNQERKFSSFRYIKKPLKKARVKVSIKVSNLPSTYTQQAVRFIFNPNTSLRGANSTKSITSDTHTTAANSVRGVVLGRFHSFTPPNECV